MKKGIKGFITIFLSLIMLLGMTACSSNSGTGNGGEVDIDTSKSQLYVYSYDGGVGNEWLRGEGGVIERFEEKFADYSFEPGKLGVQIVPDCKKDDASLSSIDFSQNEVFFSEWVQIPSFISSNKFLEIDDLVTTDLSVYLEGRTTDTDTIEDKLYQESKDFFAMRDSKFYALPHYSHFGTLTYNKALFDSKGLYLAKEVKGTGLAAKFISAANTTKSCGPDGEYNTSDDGLPATWDEMWNLFDYMKQKSVTPISWTGGSAEGYTKNLLTSIYMNLAGKADASVNWTLTSKEDTVNIITSFDKNSNPVVSQVQIGATNDTLMSAQLEKYQAMCAYDKIIDNKNWQSAAAKGVEDNMAAQSDFILSVVENHATGILVEGSYWYNESADANYFYEAEVGYDDFWDRNEFKVMPMPRVYSGTALDVANKKVAGTLHNKVVWDQSDSVAAISSKIKDDPNKVKLAKMFLAFCYTQESLELFNIHSSCPRFMNYTVDSSKLKNDYARDLYEYVSSSDIILAYANNQRYINDKNAYTLHLEGTFWKSASIGDAFNGMVGSGKKAIDYFKNYMTK